MIKGLTGLVLSHIQGFILNTHTPIIAGFSAQSIVWIRIYMIKGLTGLVLSHIQGFILRAYTLTVVDFLLNSLSG